MTPTKETEDESSFDAVASLKVAVRAICHVLEIEVDAAKEGQIAALSPEKLVALTKTLAVDGHWPDSF